MQLLLKGGSTRNFAAGTTPVYFPITVPILAAGTVGVSGLVEIPAGLHADLRAMLAYRWFLTDDSLSAQAWQDAGNAQSGPGKSFQQGTIASVGGLRIELGIKLYTVNGPQTGRANLWYPIVVTT